MMSDQEQQPYRVLARKYRPQSFDDLIGQGALVQTLTNAIQSGRIAQAYMLTGIRGVGKTTTARIIAKALNYKDGPTAGPTDDCELCKAIAEDRHPDILEMDAASRTGIDDIREIIDGVRYAPTEARYKVYIIDEVHMLSKQAFNALLKTLEEPPEKVIFIFATTEIRKVPITILSRCQRFDLRRIDLETLSAHYKKIAELESVTIEDEALTMISRAADGSVRDGLSLLDQAIAMSDAAVTADQVRSMLGLADQAKVTDLLDHVFQGNIKDALDHLDNLYSFGAEPLTLIQDMLDHVHLLTRLRTVPNGQDQAGLTPDQRERLQSMSAQLSMPTLAKAWQILLKGLGEIQNAPRPQAALEMLMMRLCYTADLPDPADLIKKLKDGSLSTSTPPSPPVGSPDGAGHHAYARTGSGTVEEVVTTASAPQPAEQPQTLEDVVALLETHGKFSLAIQVKQYVRLVRLKENRLEFAPAQDAPAALAQDLTQALRTLTNARWLVAVSQESGQATLKEINDRKHQETLKEALNQPLVKDIIEMFPGAEITRIYPKEE